MNKLATTFQWIELDGKKYCTQPQLAEMLGIKVEHLKRHLNQRQINLTNLVILPGTKKILYPYELVCMALFMLEVKSEIGKQLKRDLAMMVFQPQKQLPVEKPLLLAPPKATRDQLRQEVAKTARHNDIPYNEVWHTLWAELDYRCHVRVKQRADNQDKRPLDVIDELKLCEVSIAILKEVYR